MIQKSSSPLPLGLMNDFRSICLFFLFFWAFPPAKDGQAGVLSV